MNKVRDGCIKANSWQNNEEKMRLGTRSTKGLKKAYDRQEDLASITSHIHSWVLFLLWRHPFIFLELFLHWSPVAYWAPTDLGSFSFSILSFCLFILLWGSQGKNTEVVCHSLLQWTTVCQASPP